MILINKNRASSGLAATSSRAGFTFTEIMVAATISSLVLAGAMTIFITGLKSWQGIGVRMTADSDVNMVMSKIIYGTEGLLGLRAAAAMQTTVSDTGTGWIINYKTSGTPPQQNSISYNKNDNRLVMQPGDILLGTDIVHSKVEKTGNLITITIGMEKTGGRDAAYRELTTTIACRNVY